MVQEQTLRKPLRIEIRGRNNRLWHMIFDRWPSVAAFCRERNYTYCRVGGLLNLTSPPYDTRRLDNAPTQTAERLSREFHILIEDLFPPTLYRTLIPKWFAAELDVRYLPLETAGPLALPPTQEEEIERQELTKALGYALSTLTPKEEKVIRTRFGLAGGEEMSYEEVGQNFAVTRERIRQYEAKALCKLRHPSRSQHLIAFLHT